VLLPDSGRAYLSKYHSDTWCRRQGFLDGDLDAFVSPVVTVAVGTPVADARDVLASSGQPALPVVLAGRSDRFPPAAGEVLALLGPEDLAGSGTVGPAPTPPVGVGVGETAADALARVPDDASAFHLVRDGRLAGLVTRGALVG
jgi:cystathionine beta-synthase